VAQRAAFPVPADPAAEPPVGRWLLIVAGTALAVRVVYVLVVLSRYIPQTDALHYHSLAARIAAGEGVVHHFPFDFLHPTAWRPPLYPLLLGTVYRVTGARLGAAQALNIVLGTVVVVLAALVARRLAGWRAGLVTGLLAAVYLPLVFNDGPPLSEPLGLALLMATLLLLMQRRTGLAGATTALVALTRPSGQFVALVLLAWVLWRLGWRRALYYAACLVLVVSPWMIRNWIRLGSPVLVTSNGFNLNAIYSPEAKVTGAFVDAVYDPRFAQLRAGVTNEVELDRALRKHAMASLADDPWYVLHVLRRNVVLMFELRPGGNRTAEIVDGRNLRVRTASLPLVWLVLPAGLAGMWVLRRTPGIGPLVLAAAAFSASTLVAVSAPRLRAALDLACCITVGAGAAELARWRSRPAPARRGRASPPP
jgi:4-amino-4-deoxy-L-arabinose transferase-like glycosyltransferase